MATADVRVAILRKARALIEDNRFTYLCNAIGEAGWLLGQEREAEVLVAWVQRMLVPFNTYNTWLRQKHPTIYDSRKDNLKEGSTKEGRLAWLDWMIQEVQS